MRVRAPIAAARWSRFITTFKVKNRSHRRTRSATIARQPIDHAAIADVCSSSSPNELKGRRPDVDFRAATSNPAGQKILGTWEGAGKPDHAGPAVPRRRRLADYTYGSRMRLGVRSDAKISASQRPRRPRRCRAPPARGLPRRTSSPKPITVQALAMQATQSRPRIFPVPLSGVEKQCVVRPLWQR